jgi:hypothetical protein
MIDSELFEEFVSARAENKKPMTERAKKMLFKKLERLEAQGHDSTKLMENSIINGWQDVYHNESTLRDKKGFIEKHKDTSWANETTDNVKRIR